MRPTIVTLLAAGVAALAPCVAAADDPCRPRDRHGDPFAACFDLGSRLALHAGAGGLGGEIALRHVIPTDDRTVTWRLEHRVAPLAIDGPELRATLYDARYLRHSRDGHLMLPTRPPTRLMLPFDVGVEATVLRIDARTDDPLATLRVIRGAVFADLARAPDFTRRLAIGTSIIWDADARREPRELVRHRVVPFTSGFLDAAVESRDGLGRASARLEGGASWSDDGDWAPFVSTAVELERVLIAINDRPFSLYAGAAYEDPGRGFTISLGLRFSLVISTRSPARPR